MTKKKALLTLSMGLALAGCASSPAAPASSAEVSREVREGAGEAPTFTREPVFSLGGFATPESVLYDPEADVYLVANIVGSPAERDGNGYVSRLSTEGERLEERFAEGGGEGEDALSAPKGMAILGDELYVADIDRVFVFHRASGIFARVIPIPGATFLNDVAVGEDGAVYVSDSGLTLGAEGFSPTGTDAIHVLREGAPPRALVRDPSLGRPNGLLVTPEGVWVVTFGTGELYRVDFEGEIHDRRALPKGALDGIVALPGGKIAVSSWEAEGVYVLTPRGEIEALVGGLPSPAGIGWDGKRGRLLAPLFMEDEVRAVVFD